MALACRKGDMALSAWSMEGLQLVLECASDGGPPERVMAARVFIEKWAGEAARAAVPPACLLKADGGLLWSLSKSERILGFEKKSVVTTGTEGVRAYGFLPCGTAYQLKPRTAARRIAAVLDRHLAATGGI